MLQDEIKAASLEFMENAVIQSSVNSIPGRIRAATMCLLSALCLVPMDTYCPLSVMSWLYEAVMIAQGHGDVTAPTRAGIRRLWIPRL